MDAITTGVASNGIWAAIAAAWRRLSDRQIKITHPRPQGVLTKPEKMGGSFSYPVSGTLKHLPKGHEIWVLTQNERTGQVWPQGFFMAQYNRETGMWMGKVNGSGGPMIRIIAVVAPPTSQDFFRYFQKLGTLRNYQFEPLTRVPLECSNYDSVQVEIPTL
jgi:hypothetical protein